MPDVAQEYAQDIAIVKEALHTKLWRETPDQHEKWLNLLNRLSQLHGVSCPSLYVEENATVTGSPGVIFLNKYSLISLLHIFGRLIGMDYAQAVAYSEGVFASVYPIGAAKLARNEATGFLVKS